MFGGGLAPAVRASPLQAAPPAVLQEPPRRFPAHFCFRPQGGAPEDFSNLPPEQRRKKLQQKVDELNKDIQKETDQR